MLVSAYSNDRLVLLNPGLAFSESGSLVEVMNVDAPGNP